MAKAAYLMSFRDSLGGFLSALDNVHSTWPQLFNQSEGPGVVDEHAEALARLKNAQTNVRAYLKLAGIHGELNRALAPRGQKPQEWFADLLSLVRKAWHLCRFTGTVAPKPDAKRDDPDTLRLRKGLLFRLPAIHDKLREAWLYLEDARWIGAVSAKGAQPKGKGGRRAGSGRAKDPKVQQRNRKMIAAFKKGDDVGAVSDRFGVSAPTARKVRSDAYKAGQLTRPRSVNRERM